MSVESDTNIKNSCTSIISQFGKMHHYSIDFKHYTMNFTRLLHTPLGKVIISILLGLGLATLFRKVCTDKNCITFKGPILGDIDGKIYKYGEQCYTYDYSAAPCDKKKQVVSVE